ncbi:MULTISPECIES: DUF2508 family protein [Thermoanaerobacterium]|uniref:Uncharacterized protein n=1 Tax=Thermoanaerobacterium xylanolyticum (strain ATCC 49914 / DSM 7097 / LX-11) TaxID=858215 RepID=F6BLD9_THEXL|nr:MULTISPECIES: DUF2508 family protein [Thermoanaerobacterium]AEF16115.1 hypothetical protein Thexy_0052 [Thermoanaerobacterium xylanolyticum LX-11]MDE4543041.1 DUF2508 family protein [Thermoanaerobacterium sp. R66]ORX22824.1 histidinol-phosphatase [Thermoanaerobacterium sp. PSU-2]HHV74863.1 DUF2508 family protein [Thermoanaerobacterium sp.]
MGTLYKIFREISATKEETNDENDALIDEVKNTMRQLKDAEMYFQSVTDPDLIDQAIYNIESLRKKYTYLLKKAKENGVNFDNFNSLIS